MAENIIILPGSSKFEFYDSGNTRTTWVFVSDVVGLRFSSEDATLVEIVDDNPSLIIYNSDLWVNSITNTWGKIIDGTGWLGNSNTGPQGSQGSQGAQGAKGFAGFEGAQGAQGAHESMSFLMIFLMSFLAN